MQYPTPRLPVMQGQQGNRFIPQRLRTPLLPLRDQGDIELAIAIRGGLRRAVNCGDVEAAAYFADLAAVLVRRRAVSCPNNLQTAAEA